MDILAVELRSNNIKIEYADGSREEVEAGIYERKNTDGDTVQQRPATVDDTARLAALAAAFELANAPSSTDVTSIEVIGASIEITYADGTKEEIANGIYERKNAANRTIIERDATASDTERLNNLINGGTTSSGGDDGTPDQGSEDVGAQTDDDGTPDQGPGDVGSGTETAPTIVLEGTEEDERIHGRKEAETINGHGGDDNLRGRAGDDRLDGGSGNDRMRGDHGDDTVIGGDGDDAIRGDHGNDRVEGGAGDDNVRGNHGHDTVIGGDGDDILRGDQGRDLLQGGDGNDRLKGGSGRDVLEGGEGDDKLIGNRGHDTLDGGNGRDVYVGGLGDDVFVFHRDDSLDKIRDFGNGADLIDLSSYELGGFTELLEIASERNGDTYLRFGAGDILRIDDVQLTDLDASDFIL